MTFAAQKMVIRVIAGGAAIAACLGMAACGGSNGANSANSSSTITVFNGATGTINENWSPFSPTALQPTLGVIYEPLYYYNIAKKANPKPMLATGYQWNKDGNKLTITTRKGVKWSDGKQFTAADVAYTFQLIHDTPALNTSGLSATAEAVDDTHAILTFPKKNSFIEEANVLGNQAIVAKHIWEKIKDPMTNINANPVGTGSFKLSKFSSQTYTLTANEQYWNGAPKIKNVRYISLSDADGATSALLAGQVDWMSAFIPNIHKILKNSPNLSYVNTPALTTAIITCSNAQLGCSGPQTDTAVRQAMYYAMNRSELNKLAGSGFGKMGSPTMLEPERQSKWIAKAANRTTPKGANISKAKGILDAAGWISGSDGIRQKNDQRLEMTIQTVSGWSDYISINDTLRQQFKKIGIDLKTTLLAWNEWNNNEQKGNYQLSLDSFGMGASDDPYFQYNPKYRSTNTAKVGETASGGNLARYTNQIVDDAIETASHTDDDASKLKQYGIIQDQIVKDDPYIPVYVNSMLTEFNNSKVTGWPTKNNIYSLPASWKSWDNGLILQRLEPKK